MSVALAVQYLIVYAQGLEQLGQDDATHAVDGVGADAEPSLLDGFHIGQAQLHDAVYMALVHGVVLDDAAQLLHRGIVEVLLLSHAQHLGAVGSGQELALAVQQLQCIPLRGVMAGGDDDAAVGLVPAYSQLGRRRGGQTDVDDLAAHACQGAAHHVANHRSADAAVATDHDSDLCFVCRSRRVTLHSTLLISDEGSVCRCKLNDV